MPALRLAEATTSGAHLVERGAAADLLPGLEVRAPAVLRGANRLDGVGAQGEVQRCVASVERGEYRGGELAWVARLAAVHAGCRRARRPGRAGVGGDLARAVHPPPAPPGPERAPPHYQHADAERPDLVGQGLRHPLERVLGRAVGAVAGEGHL